MKSTNVLDHFGSRASFVPFPSGPPMNEAALSGNIDVLLTADQPAVALLSKSDDFVVVARLMYNRVSVYVPPNSPVKTMADLAGKRLGVPIGAAAQRAAYAALTDAGVDPQTELTVVNLDMAQQTALVSAAGATAEHWDGVDALAGFDPVPAILQVQGEVRYLNEANVVAVVVMRKAVAADSNRASAFLRSLAASWVYFAQHSEQVDTWYKADAKFGFDGDTPLRIAAAVEPNAAAKSVDQVRLTFTADDVAVMQKASDFLVQNKLIAQPVTVTDHVDTTLAEAAQKSVADSDVNAIQAK